MTGLTKENWWDAAAERHPEGFAHFSAWIDQVKQSAEWSDFIQAPVKFHDMPFEFQVGLLLRYLGETGYDSHIEIDFLYQLSSFPEDVAQAINWHFEDIEKKLRRERLKPYGGLDPEIVKADFLQRPAADED